MATSDIKKGPLYVDSTNNRVGVGTSSPATALDVTGAITTDGLTSEAANGTITSKASGASFCSFTANTSAGNNAYVFFQQAGTEMSRITAYNGDTLAFSTGSGATEIARFTTDGLTFNGDTAAANALDDYEEGTFTPTLYHSSTNNSTFSSVNGEYTKIGNTVTCQLRIDGGNSGTAGSFLVIGGLPFAVSQAQGNMGIGIWGSNPSQQVGNIHGFNPPRVFKGGQDVTTQMTFFTAMLVYKTS